MSRILITGAAGSIGRVLARDLPAYGLRLRLLDRQPITADTGSTGSRTVDTVTADITDAVALDAALDGVSAIVHLAGNPTEAPFADILRNNLDGTYQVFEAARRHGVRRIVYASSNHAVGFTPRAPLIGADVPPRPDTYYGLSKVFGEALGRLYVDRYHLQVACLRIGSFAERPTTPRHLSTWLSHPDAVRLVAACLAAPDLTYAVVYGISANTRGWWDLAPGRALGYFPIDDAETHAADIVATHGEADLADPIHALLGGQFTGPEFDASSHAPDLPALVADWIAADPDPRARTELQALLDAGSPAALDQLAERFAAPLTFGTAGLRGPLRAGPNGMNRSVVRRAAAGLAAYLKGAGADGPVVIGYDARHGSTDFARDSAAVVQAAGRPALLLPGPLPTPVLAFAVRHLHAAAGVMVTASHNPPGDNGYKVYLADGSQIVPPIDHEIEAAIGAVGSAAEIDLDDGYQVLGEDVVHAYVREVAGLVSPGQPRDLTIAYTPLHGVGAGVVRAVFAAAGFPDLHVVAEQERPDPRFPTVAFPNPEEPGATDLLRDLAIAASADLAIANDPDADRCAVLVGGRMLTGDEVGVLLADHLMARGSRPGATFATTIVSSSLLAAICARRGVPYAETLTGFKWIMRAGEDLGYGYEEALGYAVAPDLVRDKDGVSAALLLAEMAAAGKAAGRTLGDRLDEIAAEYGVYATGQLAVRVTDLPDIAAMMTRVRGKPPSRLLGRPVTAVDDLLPAADVLRIRADGVRVVVRPSGTEPKLKAYLEVVVEVGGSDVEGARAVAADLLAILRTEVATLLGVD